MGWESIKAVVLLALMASVVNAIGRLLYDAAKEGGQRALERSRLKRIEKTWAAAAYYYPKDIRAGTANGEGGYAGEHKDAQGGTEA